MQTPLVLLTGITNLFLTHMTLIAQVVVMHFFFFLNIQVGSEHDDTSSGQQ